jgi:hypothetical protein
MELLITLVSVFAYLASWAYVGRRQYREIRPYTEPLTCTAMKPREHNHNVTCYRRPNWRVDSREAALIYAGLTGLLGPVGILAYVAGKILRDDKPTPEEVAAKTVRLEKKLGISETP